eukprot:11795463-Ditylum_brightwellii.AAC.1
MGRVRSSQPNHNLNLESNEHFGNELWANGDSGQDLLGFHNVQSLPNSRTGMKNYDLTEFMKNCNFDHIGISKTGRKWDQLSENDWIPY